MAIAVPSARVAASKRDEFRPSEAMATTKTRQDTTIETPPPQGLGTLWELRSLEWSKRYGYTA